MSDPYSGPERRAPIQLSDDQLNEIVERVCRQATDHIYLEIGKATVRAALYLAGAGLAVLAAWLGIDTSKFGH